MRERQLLRRRAQKSNAPLCDNFDRADIAALDGWECSYCGILLNESTATVDHILPFAVGGFHCIKNAVLACKGCNHRKGRKTFEEFLSERARKQRRKIFDRVWKRRKARRLIKCRENHLTGETSGEN